MKRQAFLVFLFSAMSVGTALAADRAIAVPARVAMSFGYLTSSTEIKPSRTAGVGFWQRSSGAKPGVGANFASVFEYQLPEASAGRLRSATFQFSGKASQCVGAEPVVVDVYAYVADGRGDAADTTVGTRVAQLSADCNDRAAFARPIDVTHIVRQTTVASGIRFVGFNVRKANNRQGPGLFNLTASPLNVVLSDRDLDKRQQGQAVQADTPARSKAPGHMTVGTLRTGGAANGAARREP